MAGELSFQISDKIRLTPPVASNGGLLATGLNITVTVYNIDDGSVLLLNQALASRGNGLYSYLWNHGRTTKTWCVAVYTYTVLLLTTNLTDYFTIDSSESDEALESGRAV